jgi:hypothetical protein
MPVLTYFTVMGPVLLAALLAISAYLDPDKAPSPAEFLGVRAASADSARVQSKPSEDKLPEFLRLKGLPLNH